MFRRQQQMSQLRTRYQLRPLMKLLLRSNQRLSQRCLLSLPVCVRTQSALQVIVTLLWLLLMCQLQVLPRTMQR